MNILRTLLEITVYSAILFALVLLLKRIFKKQFSPSLQYFVWFLLLARLAIPFTVESGFGLVTIPQETVPAAVQQTQASGAALQEKKETVRQTQASAAAGVQTPGTENGIPAAAETISDGADTAAKESVPAPAAAPLPDIRPETVLLAAWLAGVLIAATKTAADYVILFRKMKRSCILPPREVLQAVTRVKGELGIRRRVRVFLQDSCASPALTASLFPRLLFPVSLLSHPDQLYFAVRHELVHFKRGDYIVCLLMLVLRTVYWFNPVVWLMQKPIKTDMETACDNIATLSLPAEEKKAYARTVLKMFSGRTCPQPVLGMSLQTNKKTAEQRIRGIFMKNSTKKGIKFISIFAAALLIVVCFTTACQPSLEVYPGITDRDKFAAGTSVAGIDVGGMTFDEGKSAVQPAVDELLARQVEYTVKNIDAPYRHPLSALGVSMDTEAALAHAMENGGEGKSFPVELSVDDARIKAAIAADSTDWNQPETSYFVEKTADEDALTTSGRIVQNEPGTFFRVDEEALGEQIKKQIKNQDLHSFAAPGKTETASSAPGNEPVLMGTFETRFGSSAYGRRFNIWKMADIINGIKVQPGEIWSINEEAGPRTYNRGWKGAPGISNGVYQEEAGGGICQVSSTLYGAILRSEVEVVDRSHHSWPLDYVPGGLDATISTVSPDFRIKNNYDVPIYIIATCDGENAKSIQIQIYGPGFDDGLTRDFSSELIGTFGGGNVEYIDDPSLPAGTEQTIIKEHTGKKFKVYKYYLDAEENVIKTEEFTTETYDNMPAKVRRGTAAADPVPTPAAPAEVSAAPEESVTPASPTAAPVPEEPSPSAAA